MLQGIKSLFGTIGSPALPKNAPKGRTKEQQQEDKDKKKKRLKNKLAGYSKKHNKVALIKHAKSVTAKRRRRKNHQLKNKKKI